MTRFGKAGLALAVLLAAGAAFLLGVMLRGREATRPRASAASAAAPAAAPRPVTDWAPAFEELVGLQRRVIVLMAGEGELPESDRRQVRAAGQAIFHDRLAREAALAERLAAEAAGGAPGRFDSLAAALDIAESGRGLFDADRLVFREPLAALLKAVAKDGSLPAIRLHKRIADDLDALDEIERAYEKEIAQLFSPLAGRAIVLKREKWEDYLAHLRTLYARERILKERGVILAAPLGQNPLDERGEELFGDRLPPKTVALTFDDGPHARYTGEIAAILRQYGVPATFFQVGKNLGALDAKGEPALGLGAKISRELIDGGFRLGNHSFSHADLSKLDAAGLKTEIGATDALLLAIDSRRPALFRFPYGARNPEGLRYLAAAHLRSVQWNIDSLDWADPVPRSVADRVLREVDREKRGILLFHDIHDRAVKALPAILDRLIADGYRFAGWDGENFTAAPDPDGKAAPAVTTGYADSWAVVIGVNDYAKWPKLQYAVRDAQAVRETLVSRFAFAPERVILLTDGAATRAGIHAAFHDRIALGQLRKDDRVFVFFAGHGATKKLSSGRELGYIIPADADPETTAADAIPMSELQNIAESLEAKHLLFVMDACYSGLGLTRGGGGFLRQNARRIGRQMLTAGGADQTVADGGPDGHSIFTWTLLQGLAGKADLNRDGFITATELAAYVAPAVAAVSPQTPAFGSLPGSQGGEFVFELPPDTEFLGPDSGQLPGDAIALNGKLDAARPVPAPAPVAAASSPAAAPAPPPVAPVVVPDLKGKATALKPSPAIRQPVSRLAQQANDRGLRLYREKRYAEAEAEFTAALELRPDFALAANNLGFVFYKQGKFPEAARWFETTLKLDPSRAVAYLNLGDACAAAGETARAKQAFTTYLALAPDAPAAERVRKQLAN